jgi:hypothetical protein
MLGFALPVSVISSLVKFWVGAPGPFWGTLAISLLLAPFSGYAFGAMTWWVNERAYQQRRCNGSRAR